MTKSCATIVHVLVTSSWSVGSLFVFGCIVVVVVGSVVVMVVVVVFISDD